MASLRGAIQARLSALIGGDGLSPKLVRSGIGSIAVRSVQKVLSFGVAVVLARSLGAQGYGTYALVFAFVSLVAIPAQFGLPNLVTRETARAAVQDQWGLVRGVWHWANYVAGILSILLMVGCGTVAWLLADRLTSEQASTLAWGLLLIPVIALGNLRGAALAGLRRTVIGQLPEYVVRPVVFLVLMAVIIALPRSPTASDAMACHVLAATLAFAVGIWLLRRERPKALVEGPKRVFQTRQWVASVLPLGLTASLQVLMTHTDVLVLGLFAEAHDVGVYRVAAQAALLVAFGLDAVNAVAAPHIARFHAQQEKEKLQNIAKSSARCSTLFGLMVFGFFVLFGGPLLAGVFGPAFSSGYATLVILGIGQLVNAAMGSVGYLLKMSGHERVVARAVAGGAILNVILDFILIPVWGIIGAATATMISISVLNIVLSQAVRATLGITSAAFPIWRDETAVPPGSGAA